MDNETYTLLDSIRNEIETLKELEVAFKKVGGSIPENIVYQTRLSFQRILNRYEKGHEYYMGIDKNGDPQLKCRQTTRHLEREYPAVSTDKRNLDTLVNLTKGTKEV